MPKKTNITEENLPLIIEDYNNGMFGKDISKKYHIDFIKLKKKLINNGTIEPREAKLTYQQLLDVSERYKKGEHLKDLAKEYRIGITKLISGLKSNGLYFKKYKYINREELDMYIKEYQNGATPKEISLKYGRKDSVIIQALRKANVYVEKKSRWTDEEIEILKKYYPIEPIENVLRRLPRHPNKQQLHTKAYNLKITSYNQHAWSDEEIKILSEKYGKVTVDELYEEFNHRHTIDGIKSKAQKMNFNTNPFWTDEEKNIIKEYYSISTMDELLKMLPNKTSNAITAAAGNLGVKSKRYLEEKYTEEQRQFIMNNCNIMSDIEIADKLGKTASGIMAQRNKMGYYKINKDYSNYESLSKFFRSHIQQWKNNSMKMCNYECIFTGSKDFAIHHIYGFNIILREVYESLNEKNFLKSMKIEDYSKEELDYMLNIFSDIHAKYPLGVCVRKDIHDLFHSIYGSGGNTQEQWNRFCDNYNKGLYNEQIA